MLINCTPHAPPFAVVAGSAVLAGFDTILRYQMCSQDAVAYKSFSLCCRVSPEVTFLLAVVRPKLRWPQKKARPPRQRSKQRMLVLSFRKQHQRTRAKSQEERLEELLQVGSACSIWYCCSCCLQADTPALPTHLIVETLALMDTGQYHPPLSCGAAVLCTALHVCLV